MTNLEKFIHYLMYGNVKNVTKYGSDKNVSNKKQKV